MASTPASICYNNPGAMYPGPSATRFGSTGFEVIGGGHRIATFDNPVNGAAAEKYARAHGCSRIRFAGSLILMAMTAYWYWKLFPHLMTTNTSLAAMSPIRLCK